jgi:acetylornithine/succinyldiaminopimelate/putrescine aminotransferase
MPAENAHTIFKNRLAPTTPYPLGLEIERAQGLYLYSTAGKAYLDLISGVAVSNLGHSHPKVIAAVKAQADKHLHLMVYGEYVQSSPNALAQKLTSLLPEPLNCCYFTNSGAESIEGALKLAKRVTGRSEIIAFRGAYHGSTHGALSVSGNETKKRAFRPLLPNVRFLNFNATEELSAITARTAAVIVEPIQGDAGVRLPSQGFLQALRERCCQTGTQLIFDEIQTGIGRTGKWFAFMHYGVQPDILCSAKALGGGLPLGVFVASREKMALFTHSPMLGHITTFGGNPLSCAAAVAALEVIEEENLLTTVEAKGQLFEDLLQHPRIKEVRRKGLFFAFEFETAQEVQRVVEDCLEQGVICFWFLSNPTSFRIAPPLNISRAEIKKACAVIQQALEKLG